MRQLSKSSQNTAGKKKKKNPTGRQFIIFIHLPEAHEAIKQVISEYRQIIYFLFICLIAHEAIKTVISEYQTCLHSDNNEEKTIPLALQFEQT